MQRHSLAAALMMLALTPVHTAPGHAQDVVNTRIGMFDASDPQGFTNYMRRNGYQAELGADAESNPEISGRLSRTDYTINFYECENGVFCNSIQFLASAPATAAATLEAANAFNVAWRYTRVTLVNGEIRLQMDVNLDAGVSADNLRDTLDIWRQLLAIFEREFLTPA